MSFKVCISDPKTRRTFQKEAGEKESALVGRKIRDKISGDFLGLHGYELEITGGSDKQGFPMRGDISGQARKRVILTGGPGFHPQREGQRKRRSVRGNVISVDIVQVNTKVIKHGSKSLEEIFGVKAEEKHKKEEKKAEEHRHEHKEEKAEQKEEHRHEHKEEKHAEQEHKAGEHTHEHKEEKAEQKEEHRHEHKEEKHAEHKAEEHKEHKKE